MKKSEVDGYQLRLLGSGTLLAALATLVALPAGASSGMAMGRNRSQNFSDQVDVAVRRDRKLPSAMTPYLSSVCTPVDPKAAGYRIFIQGRPDPQRTLAAQFMFLKAPTGRSPWAGHADVSVTPLASGAKGWDIKSTDQSPFKYEMTVDRSNQTRGWTDASLVTGELFGNQTLSAVAYRCRFSRSWDRLSLDTAAAPSQTTPPAPTEATPATEANTGTNTVPVVTTPPSTS